jgi:hypothetical protein
MNLDRRMDGGGDHGIVLCSRFGLPIQVTRAPVGFA